MSTVDTLVAARALIADPANWIKGKLFREVDGRKCYCAGGAIEANGAGHEVWSALTDALSTTHPGPISFNDDPATTHADVLALFDRAIEAERAKAVSA